MLRIYALVSHATVDQVFSDHWQLFLPEQGYQYRIEDFTPAYPPQCREPPRHPRLHGARRYIRASLRMGMGRRPRMELLLDNHLPAVVESD